MVTCYKVQMVQVRNVILETALDAPFKAPVPFESANLKRVALNALEKFGKYELRPNQFVHRLGDQLFDYGLYFNLFNNQASIRITPDRVSVRVQGAKNLKDLDILLETLIGTVECVGSAVAGFTFTTTSHAAFDLNAEGRDILGGRGSPAEPNATQSTKRD